MLAQKNPLGITARERLKKLVQLVVQYHVVLQTKSGYWSSITFSSPSSLKKVIAPGV